MSHPRQRTPSNEIEKAIVGAAFRLLEAEGPEALSVRRVAAEAGVAPMGVYNHFEGGKNGVVDALFRVGFEVLTGELDEVLTISDPIEAMRAGLHEYRRLALEHPRTYEVMFLRAIPGFEPSEQSHLTADEAFETLVVGVSRGMRRGAFREDDPREVAQQVWASIHGAVALELCGICLVPDMERTYGELVEMILRGISVPGALDADAPRSTSTSGSTPGRGTKPTKGSKAASATTKAKAGRSGSPAPAARPARAR